MVRHNNQLPNNLPQLQNLIKRDPASYKDEFLQQQRHYKSLLAVFTLRPSDFNKSLDELVMFMAQVAHCYPGELKTFAQELTDLLQTHGPVLDKDMRMTFCRALILLRNKKLLTPTDLLSLFFGLLRSQDKELRKFLESHIVSDIKNLNSKHKDAKLNRNLQNFMYTMLKDNNAKAAKMSLGIMIDLYKKNIWKDTKTVNVISTGCFSKITKVMVAALKFFVTIDTNDSSDDSDSSSSDDEGPNTREVIMANKVSKTTRKRQKNLKKVKKLVEKNKRKKKQLSQSSNFAALTLIHDPQGFAEKLFHQLEKRHERFEVKMLTLDVVSRLIGLHQLILFNFYPYVQRFLQPHQKEVVKMMQFVAQSSHELVPPDILEPVLRALVNNFVTERNSSDVMAIGLNAIREMCARAPLVMTEDLLKDLAQYKNYRERSVMMAAKSLIHVYRSSMPHLLHKKDRGRPTEATMEIVARKFGEIDAKEFVPGAEVLLETDKVESCNESDNSDDEWVNVSHSEDENEQEDEDEQENESGEELHESHQNLVLENSATDNTETVKKVTKKEQIAEKREKAAKVSSMRILTDEDFKRIEIAQLSKQITTAKNRKRPAEPNESSKGELVRLKDIENIYKKRKHDKQTRIESIKKGQEDREKFGYKDGRLNPFSSKTNREKNKNKNFMMIKHKAKGKVKKSFKDKQLKLRDHLLKLKKMK
ncbi:protein SDA1 homolog [Daktulosphaira vitifoliae]|uniref:protein SDA1 homolog n=1 Tax=Daktulosphaira vitifoliae TaxID=58002 RepID=UPI0021A9C58F|nr:protein SDA1 homolog [Daktulosphaira vitifoliae]